MLSIRGPLHRRIPVPPQARLLFLFFLLCTLPFFGVACESDSQPLGGQEDSTETQSQEDLSEYRDPGTGPFEEVAEEDLIERCGLDPEILASIDAETTYPYAIVRYGLLCHEHYPAEAVGPDEIVENYSATKTLAAAVVGLAVKMSADLDYPLSDTDRMDQWVDAITFNPDAQVAHVLAMVGHSESLAYGLREFSYDAAGTVQINRLSEVVEAVIAQDPPQFQNVETTGEFARKFLFEPLGMTHSEWGGEIFGFSWKSNLRDMARLGLVLTHDGVYDQERLLPEDWVYKMTHPAFEDANTAYGYLTWLAAKSHHKVPLYDEFIDFPLGDCQPAALWREYPHGLSESTDCEYLPTDSCEQVFDAGVFAAVGYEGQIIAGHPGLDLVLVTKNSGTGFVSTPWDLIRRALVEHDTTYPGDEDAFCEAYAAGEYAPDLILLP